ncbi:RnfABCDGE type electron transport complex subunit G [candidate division KSB1 bacterium]|nr:RnfABCDGE type electron transport complex subunit G [candidate division KSB1 bacterium]
MKNILKLGAILLLVTAIASAVLAFVNKTTLPFIIEQERIEEQNALTEALPSVNRDALEKQNDGNYIAYDTPDKKRIIGYIVFAKGNGYSSVIQTVVGIDTTGKIVGLKILKEAETPGLGTKIEEVRYGEPKPWFQQQFINLTLGQLNLKPQGEITAITGATISSRAVTNSIKDSIKKLTKQ